MLLQLKKASNFGINATAELNFQKVLDRKKNIIEKLQKGILYRLQTNNVDYIQGIAQFKSPNEIVVDSKIIETKKIIIATGSRPIELPQLRIDGKKILSSDHILEIDSIPKSLLIVGGGVIGCEFAGIFSTFGSKVSIVELMDRILPMEDEDISKKLEIQLKKKGIEILTKTTVDSVEIDKFDRVLMCVGRAPNLENIGIEKLGIKIDRKGIIVDNFLQTNIDNIFAAGDCIGGILLAHVASYEGVIASENAFNKQKQTNYLATPNCIFTNPEIGSVGLSEKSAKDNNYKFKVIKFDFLSSGMAHILDETDGFIKMIIDETTNEIIGASIIGPKATELITSLTLAVRNRMKISQINDTIIAHPTLSEGIQEAVREYYSV
jgi:dihydrolipoamide dehydrogenase